jgi:phosphohistidine phosphatase
MRVIVARHGKAFRDSATGLDRDRELKPRGRAQADFLGLALAGLEGGPGVVVSSPFARARETAERIGRVLGVAPVLDERLEVGAAVSAVLGVIAEHAGAGAVCVVGHNPTFEEVVGTLVGGVGANPDNLRTGEAVVIDVDADRPIGTGRVAARIRLVVGEGEPERLGE